MFLEFGWGLEDGHWRPDAKEGDDPGRNPAKSGGTGTKVAETPRALREIWADVDKFLEPQGQPV